MSPFLGEILLVSPLSVHSIPETFRRLLRLRDFPLYLENYSEILDGFPLVLRIRVEDERYH